MKLEKDLKENRDKLINYLSQFTHNEIHDWSLIDESFEKYREIFYNQCKVVNEKLINLNEQSDRDEIAKQFLQSCHELYNAINKDKEFVFKTEDHVIWHKFIFHFPLEIIKSLKTKSIFIINIDTAKQYKIPLSFIETLMIWRNLRKIKKEFDNQKQIKLYKLIFRD